MAILRTLTWEINSEWGNGWVTQPGFNPIQTIKDLPHDLFEHCEELTQKFNFNPWEDEGAAQGAFLAMRADWGIDDMQHKHYMNGIEFLLDNIDKEFEAQCYELEDYTDEDESDDDVEEYSIYHCGLEMFPLSSVPKATDETIEDLTTEVFKKWTHYDESNPLCMQLLENLITVSTLGSNNIIEICDKSPMIAHHHLYKHTQDLLERGIPMVLEQCQIWDEESLWDGFTLDLELSDDLYQMKLTPSPATIAVIRENYENDKNDLDDDEEYPELDLIFDWIPEA